MNKRHLLHSALICLLAVPFTARAQQSGPPAIQARPLPPQRFQLSTNAPQSQQPADPRGVDFAERVKAMLDTRAFGAAPASSAAQSAPAAASKLQQRAVGEVAVRMRSDTGTPRFIEAERLEPAAAPDSTMSSSDRDVATARNFLRANAELLRLKNPDGELVFEKAAHDDREQRHLRFTQQHDNVPVWPAEVGVHLDRNGDVYLMTGAYVPTPGAAAGKPALDREQAIEHARGNIPSGERAEVKRADLIIYAPGAQTTRLAWKTELATALHEHWHVVVDAENGRILENYNKVCFANVAGSGVDENGTSRALNVFQLGSTYFMVDTSKPMFDPTSQPPRVDTTRGAIFTFDARNQPAAGAETFSYFHLTASSPSGFNAPEAVGAAYNISQVYDYYRERHNRNSLDGNGGSITAIVRYGVNYKNAFWSNPIMAFGQGDKYASALDVAAHEVSHGVIETTANLIYADQPGALNESFADIFGEMVENRTVGQNDWLLGTTLSAPIRDMKNPGRFDYGGKPLPSKMSEFFRLPNDANNDNGGVHINSSIINRCFYLLVEGLDGGIGRGDAERIFYRALSVYLMQNSQFVDARLACVRAAKDLFGDNSVQAQRTAAAFDAVEIFESKPTPPKPDVPEVQGADSTLFIFGSQANGFILARRETALNDPAHGTLLGNNLASGRPPVVTGNGRLAMYVTADNDFSFVNTDGTEEAKVGVPGLVHSVGMAPDGRKFGYVLLDSNGVPDNRISVTDFSKTPAETITYELTAPATEGARAATVKYADAMTFTADGRFLIYDAVNAIRSADGAEVEVFSIYALELATRNVYPLISPLPDFNIGNPALSRTSDNYMVFEAIDGSGKSYVFTCEISTGTVQAIAVGETAAFPVYTGGDEAVIYNRKSPGTNTGTSLVRQAVAENRMSPVGEPTVWLADGANAFIYRRGNYVSPIAKPLNISTRMRVESGDRVLIGGFIVSGSGEKRVLIRGLGPSLPVSGALADPVLELDGGAVVNDNWRSTQEAEISATGIPPSNNAEAAIIARLSPGGHTAIVRGKGGATGVGLVEVYDLDSAGNAQLANISTRGQVQTADNVMIGGFIIGGTYQAKVLLRAIGPSLSAQGVSGALQDPTLELVDGQGNVISNDNWRESQEAEIAAILPPNDNREAAIVANLVPGFYTAVVRGKGNTTGVALVEGYNLQ